MVIRAPQRFPSTQRALPLTKNGSPVHLGFSEKVRGGQGADGNSRNRRWGNARCSCVQRNIQVSTKDTHPYSARLPPRYAVIHRTCLGSQAHIFGLPMLATPAEAALWGQGHSGAKSALGRTQRLVLLVWKRVTVPTWNAASARAGKGERIKEDSEPSWKSRWRTRAWCSKGHLVQSQAREILLLLQSPLRRVPRTFQQGSGILQRGRQLATSPVPFP